MVKCLKAEANNLYSCLYSSNKSCYLMLSNYFTCYNFEVHIHCMVIRFPSEFPFSILFSFVFLSQNHFMNSMEAPVTSPITATTIQIHSTLPISFNSLSIPTVIIHLMQTAQKLLTFHISLPLRLMTNTVCGELKPLPLFT